MTRVVQSLTMTDTEATPAAFTEQYWSKAPRQLTPPVKIMGINVRGDRKEFILENGARIVRETADIKQLITTGTTVQVELIGTGSGHIVTGMFLPQVNGWAWKMTAQDLADYAQEVQAAVGEQQMKVRLAMIGHLKSVMLTVLHRQPRFQKLGEETQDQLAEELATEAFIAMETGPQ